MKAESTAQLDALCTSIRSKGYPTGSKVFGVATANSDVDFVMCIDDAYEMYSGIGITTFDMPSEDYACCFISLKYKSHNECLNLILVPSDDDLSAWEHATSEMLKMDKELIRNKMDRQKYFGWLLTDYYSYIPKGQQYKRAVEFWGQGTVPR